MSGPRTELAELLDTLATDAGVDVNIADQPPASLAAPALVIRPDNPWRRPGQGQPFSRTLEQYAVVAVVATSGDAVDELRRLTMLVEDVADTDGWSWTETSGIVQITHNGIDYLGATSRVARSEG